MARLHHSTAKAVQFLGKYRPGGPWALTSIVPDGTITTRTFRDPKTMTEWIKQRQGKQNLYFHVNPTFKDITKKASKEDIKEVRVLHVDVDPGIGEDLELERERILELVSNYKIPPSLIIDSGGGYQAFWFLKEPFELDGTLEKCAEIEAYNRQIEIDLGGDHCHNVDRIMRLPHTINIPNKRKIAKGRSKAPSAIVEHHKDRLYELKKFKAAAKVPIEKREPERGSPQSTVEVDGFTRIESLDDLPLDDETRMLIVQGLDPDFPDRFPSRSEWMWFTLNRMVRCGLTDTALYSILLDPTWGIAEHCLDQRHPQNYVVKQIRKAKDDNDDDTGCLAPMNQEFCVILDVGNRMRVVWERFDPVMKRMKLVTYTFADFKNSLNNQVVKVKTKDGIKYIPKGTWWLGQQKRHQRDAIVFAPRQEIPNVYNLWRGFALMENKSDKHESFLKHVWENICSKDKEQYEYLIGWMARVVQHPSTQSETGVVMRGEQGTGKSFFANSFGALFGRHYQAVSDPKHLVGNFNAHLQDCCLVFGDEAVFAGDGRQTSVLKTLITEPTLTIERKGVDAVQTPNYLHVIMASNSQWVVPAGHQERRYFVVDVSSEHRQDLEYFGTISKDLEGGGSAALLHYLLNYNLENFNVRNVPKTLALQEQKLLSFTTEESWWFEKLSDGRLFLEDTSWQFEVAKNPLQLDYERYALARGQQRKVSPTILGRFLGRVCPPPYPKSIQKWAQVSVRDDYGVETVKRGRPYFYQFPPLEECRRFFEDQFGGSYEWPNIPTPEEQEDIPF